MRIAPVSFLKLNSINNNIHTQKPSFKSQSDVFVKTNNATKTSDACLNSIDIDEKYQPFKNNLVTYVLQHDECSADEIERIFRQYSPDTSFKDYSQLPKTTNAHEATAAYIEQKLGLTMGSYGKLELEKFPQTVYARFPKDNSFDEKVIFLDRILHEATHVFASDSKHGSQHEKVIGDYIKTSANIGIAVDSIRIAPQIFAFVEKDAQQMLYGANAMKSLPREIDESLSLDKLFKEKYNVSSNLGFSKLISDISAKAGKACHFDREFVLNYIIAKANEEKQAYQNALDFDKSMLGISSKTDFDLRIELYDSLIKSAQGLKQN